MKRHLFESAELQIEDVQADTWPVLVISEGKGSSGTYSGALLEKYHSAFDDALSFNNHPTAELQTRDWTMIAGEIVGATWIQTSEDGKKEVWANYRPDPDHREKLARYKSKLGLSIFIEGDGSVDSSGEFLVESFNGADPYKSVDVVIAAGRGGKFAESLRESYEAQLDASEKPGVRPSAQEHNRKEKHHMDEATQARIDALLTAVESLVAARSAEAAEAVQAEADEKAVEARVESYAAAIAQIEAADLLPSQVSALRAEAKAGKDVTQAIEDAKAIRDEVRTAVQAESKVTHFQGRPLGESAAPTEIKFSGFKG